MMGASPPVWETRDFWCDPLTAWFVDFSAAINVWELRLWIIANGVADYKLYRWRGQHCSSVGFADEGDAILAYLRFQ